MSQLISIHSSLATYAVVVGRWQGAEGLANDTHAYPANRVLYLPTKVLGKTKMKSQTSQTKNQHLT